MNFKNLDGAVYEAQTSRSKLFQLIGDLKNPKLKEQALLELNKNREFFPDLAPLLWFSIGTAAALVQEIMVIYPLLSPPVLTSQASNRVCNALALLQCLASHPDTRNLLLKAHIPMLVYPFLNTTNPALPFQYLRLRSLGVIGALVKTDDPEIIGFFLSTELVPLCLRIMEIGASLSKTVATFIVQKILLDESGLNFVCQSSDRFLSIVTVLGLMVQSLLESHRLQGTLEPQTARLFRHIIRCYLRLSENPKAREVLKKCLPDPLKHPLFTQFLKDDSLAKKWLKQLLLNLSSL
ncbi:CCR4-NOT transcription complex subunit 9-like [Zophobas morio]|jgi:CCR4-NOT transcription complex subunit 9|uniref:CCR4-NOT transcription complex subunit 9-like n=1 Tax=Zophobas morio TaxID=2755281 RepID=UPI003083B709